MIRSGIYFLCETGLTREFMSESPLPNVIVMGTMMVVGGGGGITSPTFTSAHTHVHRHIHTHTQGLLCNYC